eukprot:scaffold971_cov32-Phaeocystis_antarctica.AAC.2
MAQAGRRAGRRQCAGRARAGRRRGAGRAVELSTRVLIKRQMSRAARPWRPHAAAMGDGLVCGGYVRRAT